MRLFPSYGQQAFLPGQKPPLRAQAVQFGWFSSGHHAIDKGAIFRIPREDENIVTWKAYLLRQWKVIEAGNDLQDTIYDGPDHYINLKERGNPPLDPEKPFRRSIEDAQLLLSPDALKTVETDWMKNPIDLVALKAEPTIFGSVLKWYDQVKKQLTQIAEGTQRLDLIVQGETRVQEAETRRAYYQELAQNLGALTHYIGDMFMPFHVAPGLGDFELWPGHTDGAHLFTEGKILAKEDNTRLVAQAKQREGIPLAHITRESLPTYLIEKMKDSYRRLHEIAAIHQATLNEFQYTVADDTTEVRKNAFLTAYTERVKPILEDQMREAQEAVSTILRAVWVESGRPSIAELEPQLAEPPQDPAPQKPPAPPNQTTPLPDEGSVILGTA